MKLFSLLATSALTCAVLAAEANLACPTVTKATLPWPCNVKCGNRNCQTTSTVNNPCDCPKALPTATLYYPCEAECPYKGCGLSVVTKALPCPPPTSTLTSTSKPAVTTSITFIVPPPKTSTTKTTSTSKPCPTVTTTTVPPNCEPIRCPLPTCTDTKALAVPCGCTVKTAVYISNCPTTCTSGCVSVTNTISEKCLATAA